MTRATDIPTTGPGHSARRGMAAVLALLFVLSGSGLLPSLLAACVGWDGEHQLSVHVTANSVRLVLSHADEPFVGPHRHSLFSELVTGVSASHSGEADHVIELKRAPQMVPAGKMPCGPADEVGEAADAGSKSPPPSRSPAFRRGGRNFLVHQHLRRLRSVVLLV